MEIIDVETLIINEKIEFINEGKFFQGIILKIYEGHFAVNISSFQDNYKLIESNNKVEYLIVHANEALRCRSEVLGGKIGDNFQLVLLGAPELIKRIERRQYIRLKVVMGVEYSFLPEESDYENVASVPANYFRQMKKTFTIDLSAGGINIVTYEDKINSEQLLVSLNIKENIKVLCTVIRKEYDEVNKNYKTGLKFKYIDKRHWQLIKNYVDEKTKE